MALILLLFLLSLLPLTSNALPLVQKLVIDEDLSGFSATKIAKNHPLSRLPVWRNAAIANGDHWGSEKLLVQSKSEDFDLGLDLGLNNAVIITANSTVVSKNRTFELGFFSPDGKLSWYLGIRFGSIPTPTYVWVANRETPISNLTSCTLRITTEGKLAILDSQNSIIWQTPNREEAVVVRLQETGNLVLLSATGSVVWQSFDYPTDTWLPGMNVTGTRRLISWRSLSDPSPGLYSLRLNPRDYNEFQLAYNESFVYWKTGNWTGMSFTDVPEMTVPYIYDFHFVDPYTSTASFWFTEKALPDSAARPPLTRFQVDVNGQLKQFTWSQQTENWNMFWSQPENRCKVYGLCGNFGVCQNNVLNPCVCLSGFSPVRNRDWKNGGYSGGCSRGTGDSSADESDVFMDVGIVGFEGATTVLFSGSRSVCEKSCLHDGSCIGLFYDDKSNICENLYGSLMNLRNCSSDSTCRDVLYVRVPKQEVKKNGSRSLVLILVGGVVFATIFLVLALGMVVLSLLKRRKKIKSMQAEDGVFPLLNLKAFTYKELCAATRGFSNKLGHGGFGAVFHGELMDSTLVAVKRLERPGSGEKEFQAEVCTIGNIQHVNLVRLRGFCSENSHRLLVYDYMSHGPLSVYLHRDGPNLSWDVRFRIAIGTARGIAYLHEECRDCIIHCDIKPENILLDSDYTAKVSDFGLAKLFDRDFSRILATMRGTWGYVAPEWISGVAITTKADVYSYGMTLLELLGGRRNVEAPPSAGGVNGRKESENEEKWFLPPYAAQQILKGNIAAVVDDRLGTAYNIEEAERVALVAIWCIQDTEEMRPAMGTVVKMLEGVVELNTPPPPKLLQALISGESYRGIQADSGYGSHVSGHGNCSQSSPSNPCSPINENMDLR